MIIPSVNFLKSNSPSNSLKYRNQPDRIDMSKNVSKKYHGISRLWQCSAFLAAGLTCLVISSAATPAVAQERVISQFSDRNSEQDVRAIQDALRRLGYFDRSSTGFFGDITRQAVLNFQRDNNLPATGAVDNITANTIFTRDRGVFTTLNPNLPDIRERFCRDQNNRNQVCAYVVLIPGDNNRLIDIRNRLLVNYRPLAENMVLEDHGRGLFIRIDQYRDRGEAENVANILRSNISPDFRVEFLPTVTPVSSRG